MTLGGGGEEERQHNKTSKRARLWKFFGVGRPGSLYSRPRSRL